MWKLGSFFFCGGGGGGDSESGCCKHVSCRRYAAGNRCEGSGVTGNVWTRGKNTKVQLRPGQVPRAVRMGVLRVSSAVFHLRKNATAFAYATRGVTPSGCGVYMHHACLPVAGLNCRESVCA